MLNIVTFVASFLTFLLQLMSPKGIRRKIQSRPNECRQSRCLEAVTLQIHGLPTERRLHKCLEVVTFVGGIDFELLDNFLKLSSS